MDLISKAREAFNLDRVYAYPEIEAIEGRCAAAYRGAPDWAADVQTINFAKTLCEETARLALLGTSIKFDDSPRGEYLQRILDAQYYNLRIWEEYALAFGTVIIKPNGVDYDVVLPGRYLVTENRNGEIWGAVFVTTRQAGEKYYTRFEYHHFNGPSYVVENKTFEGDKPGQIDREIALENSPWPDLTPAAYFDDVKKPLFAVLRTPQANNVDDQCPYGLPLVSGAITELRDLDVAYYRFAHEIDQSKRTVLLNSDRLTVGGMTEAERNNRIAAYDSVRAQMGLPDYVRAVEGDGEKDFYTEINPTLNTDARLVGINHLLSQIGYKIGFANGYFVFNEASGLQTATGVEADQQRTIQFIKDVRDRIEKALVDLIAAISKFADMYDPDAPDGDYSVTFQFGDITYNEDEDRARWLSYANTGKIPFWYYLVKFEGFTEDEAKALTAETAARIEPLFPQEE